MAAPPQLTTRSGRSVRFPRRFDDFLPGMRTAALAHIPSKDNQNPPQVTVGSMSHPNSPGVPSSPASGIDDNPRSHTAGDNSLLDEAQAPALITNADNFGVYRMYARKPIHEPSQQSSTNTNFDPQSNTNCQSGTAPNQGPLHLDMQTTDMPYYHPFSSPSAAAMMLAHHSGMSVQSLRQTTRIAHTLGDLGSDLNPLDLSNFDAAVENRRLDAYIASASESVFHREDGWLESSVRIRLPLDKKKMLESEAAEFEVGGVFHRDIIDVISTVYQSNVVKSFNHIPFKEYWKPSEDSPPKCLYEEIYSSQAMLDADDEICKSGQLSDSGKLDLKAISIPLLLYSDSTHLASFGTASSWPVYMFFGSQSRYVRAMPTSYTCHHIAYMPEVRHTQDLYASIS